MATLTPQEQQAATDALNAKDFSAEEVKLAQRSVDRLVQKKGRTPTQDMVMMFCALRRARGQGARINLSMLEGWTGQMRQSTTVKQSLYVVQQESSALSNPKVAEGIVPASDLADVPPGLLEQGVVFVDQVVPRELLGKNVSVIELALGVHRSRDISASPHALGGDQQTVVPAGEASTDNVAEPAPSASSQDLPEAKRQRLLVPRMSEEMGADSAAEEIAENCKQAFLAGRISSQDALDSTTVLFWVQFAAQLDDYAKLLIKYLVKTVLNPPKAIAFADVQVFATAFRELDKVPGLLPDTGRAICALAAYDIRSRGDLSISLNLQQQTIFYKSDFYKSFMQHRASERILAVKANVAADVGQRLAAVTSILEDGNLTDHQKEDLQFAQTIFGAASEETKLDFLMSQAGRLDTLATWEPTDARLRLKRFLDKTNAWKDADPAQFLDDCLRLVNTGSVAHIQHPVVRSLVAMLGKLVAACGEHSLLQRFSHQLLLDLACVKVDLPYLSLKISPEELAVPDLQPMLQKMLAVVSTKDLARDGEALRFLQQSVKPEAPAGKKPAMPETAEKQGEAGDGGADARQDQEPKSRHGFPVGSIVITTSVKHKSKYHNQRAEVVAELTHEVKVLLLTGDADTEVKKFKPENLKLAPPEEKDTAKPTNTAAERAQNLFAGDDLDGL
ncbi:unnamed protein product [Effrenium voratum]|nr:unnamed protein product [Effrenium voratum]